MTQRGARRSSVRSAPRCRASVSSPPGRVTRLTVSAASSSIVAARSASPVASTIAFTSRWPHSGVSSSSIRPHSRFRTPPGMSETPATSPRSSARSGQRRETTATTLLPAASAGRDLADQPQQVGLVGREHGHDAGRLGHAEAQVRQRDRVDPAHQRGELVRPARVVDERVDGRADLGAGVGQRRVLLATRRARTRRSATPAPPRTGTAPGRGCRRSSSPSRPARRARPSPHRGRPCARSAARSTPATGSVSAGLGAHERASQVELVRLGDHRAATHAVILTYGSRPAGPPSRPKPLSL